MIDCMLCKTIVGVHVRKDTKKKDVGDTLKKNRIFAGGNGWMIYGYCADRYNIVDEGCD